MIYSLTGKLVLCNPDLCVVECAGVGYACKTTLCTVAEISGLDNVTLYTHLAVKEDSVDLYGFSSMSELECFRFLISVSGVGAKFALAILSSMTPDQVALAIASEDVKAFTKIKGVGNKIAQRIVMELKDKVAKEPSLMGANSGVDFSVTTKPESNASEAVAALVVLGYSQSDAASCVARLDQNLSSDELIKQALRLLASNKF